MEPQRKAAAGPMASSSMRTSRKSFAITHSYIRPENPHKETVTVNTSVPNIERRTNRNDQNQIYQGEVNLNSIM